MDTIFINSKDNKTSDPHGLLVNPSDKINLKKRDVALSNPSIYYTWKNITMSYKNNKFKTSLTLNLSSDAVGDLNDGTNFSHKLLTDTQVSRLRKSFANGLSANIKFSKTQLSKMIQSGGSDPFPVMSFLFNPIETLKKIN